MRDNDHFCGCAIPAHIERPAPTSKLLTNPARIASATFAFSHPPNFSVRHPASQ
jgi:hypothetical protein